MLLYFLRGYLTAPNQGQKKELILVKKQKTSRENIYGGLPWEFAAFFDYLYSCGISDRPRYSYLHKSSAVSSYGEISITIIYSIGQS